MGKILKSINGTLVLIALISFLAGWQLGHRDLQIQWNQYHPSVTIQNKQPPQNITVDFKLFWDVWDLVSKDYRDKTAIDPQKMFYGAIQGMVAAIGDPYTMFLPPEAQQATSEDLGGSFSGVGLELGFNKDKHLVVMAPLEDTPASKADIKANDLIVKINGKDTSSMAITDAVKLIRGPKGTDVTLTIFRDGETQTRDVKLTRDTIVVKSVKLSFENTASGKKIAWIKLTRFGERTTAEWNDAVSQILASGSQGIILDVRNNPGGLLDDAVYIGSEFLDGGDVVIVEDGNKQKTYQKVNRQGKLLKLPMVVLVNKGSASASEIVAGALQDRNRAKMVGEQTFGKGTVQEALELPGGTGIHITTARWLTPNLRWANATDGFEPDVKVVLPTATSSATPAPSAASQRDDLQLQKALELLE